MIEIPLTQGKVAIIDDEDFELVSKYTWCAANDHGRWYAKGWYNQSNVVRMHRLIMGFPDIEVDHKNGDGLDNRRNNLRVATREQNGANQKISKANKSGFKGVHFRKDNQNFMASIMHKQRTIYLGCFDNAEDAARAYNKAALELFGEFANLNPLDN